MDVHEETLKVYTSEEIEMLLIGDRKTVDRLLIHGINNLSRVLIPHILKEDKVFEALGTIELVLKRSAWIDAEIKKKENTAEFYHSLRLEISKELSKKSGWILILAVLSVFVFWWNGHTPSGLHIPLPLGK